MWIMYTRKSPYFCMCVYSDTSSTSVFFPGPFRIVAPHAFSRHISLIGLSILYFDRVTKSSKHMQGSPQENLRLLWSIKKAFGLPIITILPRLDALEAKDSTRSMLTILFSLPPVGMVNENTTVVYVCLVQHYHGRL